jgi:DNA-binding transcriptional MocR family regulator
VAFQHRIGQSVQPANLRDFAMEEQEEDLSLLTSVQTATSSSSSSSSKQRSFGTATAGAEALLILYNIAKDTFDASPGSLPNMSNDSKMSPRAKLWSDVDKGEKKKGLECLHMILNGATAVLFPQQSGHLLAALKEKIATENNLINSSVMVTQGANQAFVNVVLSLCDSDDQVVLFPPYYFNHKM